MGGVCDIFSLLYGFHLHPSLAHLHAQISVTLEKPEESIPDALSSQQLYLQLHLYIVKDYVALETYFVINCVQVLLILSCTVVNKKKFSNIINML